MLDAHRAEVEAAGVPRIGPGELTPSNAAQVRKIRAIVEAPATRSRRPPRPRERLRLEGLDRVGF